MVFWSAWFVFGIFSGISFSVAISFHFSDWFFLALFICCSNYYLYLISWFFDLLEVYDQLVQKIRMGMTLLVDF